MSGETTQASLNLTSEEKRAYGQLFQQADNEGLGVVTGDIAVKFFERTKLDPGVLAQIWQIADSENRGLLTPAGFSVALRLIGHCQAGREPAAALALQAGPLPRFDGSINIPTPQNPATPSSPMIPQTSGPIRVPPLSADKVQEFTGLFEKAGAQNGLLGGDAAKSMFERARLPNEILGRIWMLSDTDQRGALNLTEFIVAMHLITSMKSGSLRALPQTLPAGLYEAASRRGPLGPSGRSGQPQTSGQPLDRAQSPLTRAPNFAAPLSAQTTGNEWAISTQDKAKFDQAFATIDKGRTGYINGEQAVSFFSASGLSEDTLASIWDLADVNSTGQLNRDEFAVAMFLVRQQRGKRDGRGDLPTSLPPDLVPPSMRQKAMPPSQTTAPVFDNTVRAPQQNKSAADDLFGLDAFTSEPAALPSPRQTAASPASSRRGLQQQTTGFSGFKPFQPTSSFGQGLATQHTGTPEASQQQQSIPPQAQPAEDDLLGDDDAQISNKLTSDTSELGNMSNQLGTLRGQMSEVQSKRAITEGELSTTSNQKRELESRLTQFRAQYEQEIREVKTLEERLRTSKAETQKLQQEMAMVEGAHADLTNQHKQVATALDADQRENASLKERVQRLNAEITQLKPQLEKMRSDARQQKGLVAINRKQLATSEAEKDKHNRDLQEASSEKSRWEREAAASQELSRQASPIVSPTASIASNTNPFFRAAGMRSNDGFMSPSTFSNDQDKTQGRSAFDNFFGPSEAVTEASQQFPSTSFPATMPVEEGVSQNNPSSFPTSVDASQPFEPPAPPESRQITSSALPLRMIPRSDSFSSSVKANPPASRSGDSGHATPRQVSATPTGSTHEESESPVQDLPPTSATQETASSEAPVDMQTSERETPANDTLSTSQLDTVPGAYPGDSSAATTPTTETPKEGNTNLTGAATEAQASSTTIEATPAAAERGGQASEFPPIEDVGTDDETDSTSSEREREAPQGPSIPTFEPGLPSSVETSNAPTSEPNAALPMIASSDRLPVPDQHVAEIPSAVASQLPTPGTERSPPSYDHSVPQVTNGATRESNQFPLDYDGLLPSREITHSPPQEVPQSPPQGLTAFMSPQSYTSNTGTVSEAAPASTAKQAPADDFDSAFDDLSEAQQADDIDAFGEATQFEHDFNPTFDSPAPPQESAMGLSRHQPNSSFDSAFGSRALGTSKGAAPLPTGPATSDPNWDDLFKGLDSSSSALNGGKDPFELSSGAPSNGTGEIREGPAPIYRGLYATSSSQGDQPADTNSLSPPNGSAPNGQYRQQPSTSTSAFSPSLNSQPSSTQPQYAPPSSPPPQQRRPTVPPRAISAGTEHDDPILKSLTSMGYDRAAAVKALERYDYNLDMAADHLARHS